MDLPRSLKPLLPVVLLAAVLPLAPAWSQEQVGTSIATTIESYGQLPDFALVERSGRAVTRADLLGRPTIFAFAFSSCRGPCPMVMGRMAQLAADLRGEDVRLVTVTVDPEHDTPATLQAWAKTFGADPERWLFLGGEPSTVKRFVIEGFKLGIVVDAKGEISHSTRLALVDRRGTIVGFYDSADPEAVAELSRRAPTLAMPAFVKELPAVNACLNSTCALLLVAGLVTIKRKRVGAHKACMLGALGVSAVFLALYLVYHYFHGHTPFPGTGTARTVYLAVLASHILLAVVVVPLALGSAWLGLAGTIDRHRKLAKVTLPLWLYVSVTGVAVYWTLYQVYGAVP